jgi:hypothetical protein
MGLLDTLENLVFGPVRVNRTTTGLTQREDIEKSATAVKSGRQTVPTHSTLLTGVLSSLETIAPDDPVEFIEVIEFLAKYNDDLSYAVENVVQLGGTSFHVYFDDKISPELESEMSSNLKAHFKSWYRGGMNSLVNDLLTQIIVTGSLSGEIVPNDSLDGVKSAILVSPKNIRFRYDKEKEVYLPYQTISKSAAFASAYGGHVDLNPLTYKYYPLRRMSEKPYGVPPFLSALESIKIDDDMMCGLKAIIKKLGVFGFMKVLVNPPAMEPGETEEDYVKRLQSFLVKEIQPEVEKGLDKGYMMGFRNQAEFEMQDTVTNVAGIEKLFELINVKKHSGLKQDPMMLGRNYTTTETLGRVILAKLSKQVANYQRIVATFLEDLFFMHLYLQGYPIEFVDVEFEAPMIGDELRNQQAESVKIDNAIRKYNQGILDQGAVANELGYEEPAEEEPRQLFEPEMEKPGTEKDATDPKTVDKNSFRQYEADLKAYYPEFDYGQEETCDCGHDHHTPGYMASLAKGADRNAPLNEFIVKYFGDVKKGFDKAVKEVSAKVADAMLALGLETNVDEVVNNVLLVLYREWGASFSRKQTKVIAKWVNEVYSYFRRYQGIFSKFDPKNIPAAVFNQMDLRTLDYYKKSDSLYLGKFITDRDTQKRVTAFIKEKYISGEIPIGDKVETLAAFRNEFGALLQGEDWKIMRIVSTTVNRMRNTASVSYMHQAEVDYFEIRGVNDRLQCKWCSNLQGKRFAVQAAFDKFNTIANSDPAEIKVLSPFVTSTIKDPEKLKTLPTATLESMGANILPAHPGCRDTYVAVLE